jgi:hypothetical protein
MFSPGVSASVLGLCFLLSGCVSVNTVTLYKASLSLPSNGTDAADGVAFLVGRACIHVADRGAEIHSVIGGNFNAPKDIFRVEIWILPERAARGFTFAPNDLKLAYVDGSQVSPDSVQFSRFVTIWEQKKTKLLTFDEVETIANVDHGSTKKAMEFDSPVELLEWTRIKVEFPRRSEASIPSELMVRTLYEDGAGVAVPVVHFEKIKEARMVFPGTSADGVGLWDNPHKSCRKLQSKLPTISPIS